MTYTPDFAKVNPPSLSPPSVEFDAESARLRSMQLAQKLVLDAFFNPEVPYGSWTVGTDPRTGAATFDRSNSASSAHFGIIQENGKFVINTRWTYPWCDTYLSEDTESEVTATHDSHAIRFTVHERGPLQRTNFDEEVPSDNTFGLEDLLGGLQAIADERGVVPAPKPERKRRLGARLLAVLGGN